MTPQPTSVLDKALALKAEASRLREGAVAEEQARQVTQRLDDLTSQLDTLETLLATADRLRELGEMVDFDRASLGRTFALFARRASSGLPDTNAFAGAKRRLRSEVERLRDAVSATWTSWADLRLRRLPQLRLAMLSAEQQRIERARLRDLTRLARIEVPSLTDITMFTTQFESLTDALGAVDDPSDDLVALIELLDQRAVTLDNVTDDQIALLRASGLASQIQLNRRGA